MEELVNFSKALEALKKGSQIRRVSWWEGGYLRSEPKITEWENYNFTGVSPFKACIRKEQEFKPYALQLFPLEWVFAEDWIVITKPAEDEQ